MGMLVPQPSQMPKCPSRIRSKAYSMRLSSRLSTSANCELISSWTESRATSTMSPEVCRGVLSTNSGRRPEPCVRRRGVLRGSGACSGSRLCGSYGRPSPPRPIMAALKACPPSRVAIVEALVSLRWLSRFCAPGGGPSCAPHPLPQPKYTTHLDRWRVEISESLDAWWPGHFCQAKTGPTPSRWPPATPDRRRYPIIVKSCIDIQPFFSNPRSSPASPRAVL